MGELIHNRRPHDEAIIPFKVFQSVSDDQIDSLIQNLYQEDGEDEREEEHLYCKTCKQRITDTSLRIEIDGHHIHSFTNPAEIVYRIGCFAQAHGCMPLGIPTLDFTWFKGYTWCYSVCTHCHEHMGWRYGSSNSEFHGLILANLTNHK